MRVSWERSDLSTVITSSYFNVQATLTKLTLKLHFTWDYYGISLNEWNEKLHV